MTTKRRASRQERPAPAATNERLWAGSALASFLVFCGALWLALRPATGPGPAAGSGGPGPSAGSGRPGQARGAPAPAAGPASGADDAEVQALVRGLREADSSATTCELVGRLGEAGGERATAAIADTLQARRSLDEYRCAARALARAGGEAAQSWLVELSDDRDPEVQRAALSALAKSEAPAAREAVLSAARGDDPERAPVALAALASARAPEAAPLLRRAIERAPDALLERLVRALGQTGDEAVVPALVSLTERLSPSTRRAAFAALGSIGGEAATRFLAGALAEARPSNEARLIAKALADVGGPVATRALVEAAEGSNDEALAALAESDDERVRALMVRGLAEGPPARRSAAFDYFAERRDERALPLIADALRSVTNASDGGEGGVEALVRIGGPQAVALVGELAERPGPLQSDALEALDRMPGSDAERRALLIQVATRGSKAKAVSAIQRLANDESDEAREALARIVRDDGNRSEEALAALASRQDAASVGVVVEAARAKGRLRASALSALGELRSPRVLDALVAAARDQDDETAAQTALAALVAWGGAPAEAAVERLASSPEPEDRRRLLEAVRGGDSTAARTALRRLLDDAEPSVSSSALLAYLRVEPERGMAIVEQKLRGGPPEARLALSRTLRRGHYGVGERLTYLPLWLSLAKDGEREIAAGALMQLAGIGGDVAGAAVAEALTRSGGDGWVRKVAAECLMRMGGEYERRHADTIARLLEGT
ncbi:MAG TPA: HEAT repeat domain-containing protein [Polyangiaceae bacterium]|nr:HEAT repeat domain-containing protein [Polyangiaceae bacterium]